MKTRGLPATFAYTALLVGVSSPSSNVVFSGLPLAETSMAVAGGSSPKSLSCVGRSVITSSRVAEVRLFNRLETAEASAASFRGSTMLQPLLVRWQVMASPSRGRMVKAWIWELRE